MNILFPAIFAMAFFCNLALSIPFANTSGEFYLRTVVTSGPQKFANLYPWSYHTGAGLSIPALLPTKEGSTRSYFNGTRLNADISTDFPWGWMPQYQPYAGWSQVGINGGIGSEGFAINRTKGRGDVTFDGIDWIACDWTFGVPQLFRYTSAYYVGRELPCSCARVRLIPEWI